MPPRFPRCSAFSLHKSYSVSGSESETSMSIRLPAPLIFMWRRLFRWQRKWLKAEKDLFSSAVEILAMNSLQHQVQLRISSTLQITSAERERWPSTLCRLKKYLAATMTKERDSTALTLMNIAIRRLA